MIKILSLLAAASNGVPGKSHTLFVSPEKRPSERISFADATSQSPTVMGSPVARRPPGSAHTLRMVLLSERRTVEDLEVIGNVERMKKGKNRKNRKLLWVLRIGPE